MSYFYDNSQTKIKFAVSDEHSIEIEEALAPHTFAEMKEDGSILLKLVGGQECSTELVKYKGQTGALSITNLGCEFVPQETILHGTLKYYLESFTYKLGVDFPIYNFTFTPVMLPCFVSKFNVDMGTCISGEYYFVKNAKDFTTRPLKID